MNTLARLQDWYAQQCNGEWEHASGITMQTCDNPGWWVKIDLAGTTLQQRAFAEIAAGVDAQRFAQGSCWMSCHVENGIWHGAGDASRLEHILETFLAWAEEADGPLA